MASLVATDPTLYDITKRTDPNGSIANIIEMLSKRNPILMDAVAKEGNLPTGHRFTTRNTLPAIGWRRFNDGIVPSKSTTEQYDETCGMLEGFQYVDCGLAKLNGNEAAFRASEDKAFLQALNIEACRALMYGSIASDPAQMHGFTPRFNLSTAPAGGQIIDYSAYPNAAADSGADSRSIWFICWGEDTVYLITPKGMPGGLNQEDLGKQIVDAGSSKKYTAWVTHWMWNLGLCVQDHRQVVRVSNLDASVLTAAAGTDAQFEVIINAMISAYYKLYDPQAGRCCIYTGRLIAEALHRGAMKKATSQLTIDTASGKPVTSFLGFPVRVLDALDADEASTA